MYRPRDGDKFKLQLVEIRLTLVFDKLTLFLKFEYVYD